MDCQLLRCVLLSVTLLLVNSSEYHSIVEHAVYKYPGQVQGDLELSECGPHSVCSVIRRRFWMEPVILRLCRCVSGTECPWNWAATDDAFSMPLDNRSQLKFCEPISKLADCRQRQTGISVKELRQDGNIEQSTQVFCVCRWPAYWQLHRHYYNNYMNGTTEIHNHYRCAKLKKCGWNEFCGHVVAETYSTYYRCSCPLGSLCIHQDNTTRNASELLYRGPTFRAQCVRFSADDY